MAWSVAEGGCGCICANTDILKFHILTIVFQIDPENASNDEHRKENDRKDEANEFEAKGNMPQHFS